MPAAALARCKYLYNQTESLRCGEQSVSARLGHARVGGRYTWSRTLSLGSPCQGTVAGRSAYRPREVRWPGACEVDREHFDILRASSTSDPGAAAIRCWSDGAGAIRHARC